MARLQRSCHRLIWLDPLFGPEVYQPLAGGMRAAYPFIDDLVAVNDLASLEKLGDLLADMANHRSRRPDRAGHPRVHQRVPQPPGATAQLGADMRELLPVIAAWEAEGQGIARAVVIATYGSAPRREGAVLLRADDGRIAGSVSGGCVEGATAEALAEARATGLQRVVRFGVSDEQAWTVGLACGGTIDVLVQPAIPPEALSSAAARAVEGDAGRNGQAVVAKRLPAGSPGPAEHGVRLDRAAAEPTEPLVVLADGRLEGTLGEPAADAALADAAREALARGVSTIVGWPARRTSSRSSRHGRASSSWAACPSP